MVTSDPKIVLHVDRIPDGDVVTVESGELPDGLVPEWARCAACAGRFLLDDRPECPRRSPGARCVWDPVTADGSYPFRAWLATEVAYVVDHSDPERHHPENVDHDTMVVAEVRVLACHPSTECEEWHADETYEWVEHCSPDVGPDSHHFRLRIIRRLDPVPVERPVIRHTTLDPRSFIRPRQFPPGMLAPNPPETRPSWWRAPDLAALRDTEDH